LTNFDLLTSIKIFQIKFKLSYVHAYSFHFLYCDWLTASTQ